jgi:hypothetical protein
MKQNNFKINPIFKYTSLKNTVFIHIKQSRYRPGVAQRVPGVSGSQIS